MKLIFRKKEFVLIEGFKKTTLDIRAAIRFLRFADISARNILDRVIVKHYALTKSLPPFLDAHQVEGVTWALTRSRSYLAHAPGAGKTLEAICIGALAKGTGKLLFIVPPTATANWEREIMRWIAVFDFWPSITIIPESLRRDTVDWNADIVICPDSMLTKPWVLEKLIAMKKKVVAVDEASRFKEPNAQRTIALFGGQLKNGVSPGLIQHARHAVLLDGSPMPNRPMELWAPTTAMAPATINFMDQTEFGHKYCGPTINYRGEWEFKNSSNEKELKRRMQKEFMHVVTEESLDHPERRRSILFMNQEPKLSAEHKAWERACLKTFNFKDIKEDMSQGDMATFRRELGIKKAPWVANYVSERLRNKNESILLFAWHRDVVDELALRLGKFNPGVVMGGTSERQRERYFSEFQRGNRKLLVLNIASGGRIHNLQRADRVIFAEFSWTDETNKQCEKRAARKGNTKLFTRCEYIAAPNTMDEPIINGLFRKAQTIKRIIG